MSMPRIAVFLVCTLLGLATLATTSVLAPHPVLAAPATLQLDASLQDGPQDTANSLSWLPAGEQVYVTGDQVDGYYPVTVGVLTGWVRADALAVQVESAPAAGAPSMATPVDAVVDPASLPVQAVEPEPPLDPNAPWVTVADPGPVGPAAVMVDVPIYAGPGPDFGVVGTAPVGQLVEQTGHAVSGYVTVRYVGVTGWVPLDHLGPAPATSSN